MKKIAVVGAGIAGLTLANLLKDNMDVVIFDKSRGVSGRMATRKASPYSFDHGAQFFTVRSNIFNKVIEPMIKNNIVDIWRARFVEILDQKIVNSRLWDDSNPHYVGVPGMNAINKYLSNGLNINLGITINKIYKSNVDKWIIEDNSGIKHSDFDLVVFAMPAAQANDIMIASNININFLSNIQMSACYSLMLGLQHEIDFGFDAAIVRGDDISWISVNSSKPQRPIDTSIIVTSTNKWADYNINMSLEEVQKHLLSVTKKIVGCQLNNLDYCNIHRWKYANISKNTGSTYFYDDTKKLGICGDWFIQGRIEAAFTSGYELAVDIANRLEYT